MKKFEGPFKDLNPIADELERSGEGSNRLGWMQTFTKKQFYPLSPVKEDICIEDIAHALANICRFTGHSSQFFSVAQHSVLVSELVDQRFAKQALLHDASEAYLCDIASPIKHLPEMSFYREAEDKLMDLIMEKFDLEDFPKIEVKKADKLALSLEAESLGFDSLKRIIRYPRMTVKPVPSVKAEQMFLDRWNEISKMERSHEVIM